MLVEETTATTLRSGLATLPDDELVALAQRHDESAVRTIIRRHNQRLFRAARAITRSDAEAEDVVQEAYMRAFTHLDTFRGDALLSTWLTRIAINEALNRKRRRRETALLDDIDLALAEEEPALAMYPIVQIPTNPETEAAREETRLLLEGAIDRLSEPFRIVFVLRDVQGLSTEAVAECLRIPDATVKTRLHRARRMLRQILEETLEAGFASLYPFDGLRCVHMADRVLARLRPRAGS
ncbi:RNA polymerase sigma factor [Paradevosia shaoguanensis]|uniref:RNA polymerase sigma factor n=1 Tax=Paradevosia shaoguanensis TaxID=1335043 RepID=UPI003C7227C8